MNTLVLKEKTIDRTAKVKFSIHSNTDISETKKQTFGIQQFETENHLIKAYLKDSDKKQLITDPNEGQMSYFFLIEKISDEIEDMKLNVKVDINGNFNYQFAPREYQTGSEFYFNNSILNISTEDEDSFFSRSISDKYFPKRFCREYPFDSEFWYDIVTFKKNSIMINIPELLKGEKIYFHLMTSWRNQISSNNYAKSNVLLNNAGVVNEIIKNFN